MKTKILWLVPIFITSIFGKEFIKYDTTLTLITAGLWANKIDSFYIHPIGKSLFIGAALTASCPSSLHADFTRFIKPGEKAQVACVSSACWRSLVIVKGLSCFGPGFSNEFAFDNRYYQWSLDSANIYFKILSISDNYEAKVVFSSEPFSTNTINPPSASKSNNSKSTSTFKENRFLANGVVVHRSGKTMERTKKFPVIVMP